jgi:hypothetical protein
MTPLTRVRAALSQTGDTAMRMEVSEDVLRAIRSVVEYWRSTEPDDENIIVNDLPVIEAWLVGLGRLADEQILERLDEQQQFDR